MMYTSCIAKNINSKLEIDSSRANGFWLLENPLEI